MRGKNREAPTVKTDTDSSTEAIRFGAIRMAFGSAYDSFDPLALSEEIARP
jgi:hypothetical protein